MLRAVGTPSAATLGLHPGYIASKTYNTFYGAVATGSAVPAVDTIYFYPWPVFAPITIASGYLRVVTGGAGSSAKCGIWANSTVSGRPLGAPLTADNTGVATTSSSANANLVLSVTLPVGLYWIGTKFTGTLPTCVSVSNSTPITFFYVPFAASGGINNFAISFADAYGNNMPTLAEGATFSAVGVPGTPVLAVNT